MRDTKDYRTSVQAFLDQTSGLLNKYMQERDYAACALVLNCLSPVRQLQILKVFLDNLIDKDPQTAKERNRYKWLTMKIGEIENEE